jgi:hypothetical protein
MASLSELQVLMYRLAEANEQLSTKEFACLVITEARRNFGGDKTYWPPLDSGKNVERAEAIRKAAATLPTRVVCERFGVSRQLVSHHIKKGKYPAE